MNNTNNWSTWKANYLDYSDWINWTVSKSRYKYIYIYIKLNTVYLNHMTLTLKGALVTSDYSALLIK